LGQGSKLLLGDGALATAVDMFALGMVAVTLLTGHSAQSVRHVLARNEIESLLVAAAAPVALAHALRLCLAERAENRPSAAQLAAFLDRGVAWWRESDDATAAAAAPPTEPDQVSEHPGVTIEGIPDLLFGLALSQGNAMRCWWRSG
jgi:hypothetical protein